MSKKSTPLYRQFLPSGLHPGITLGGLSLLLLPRFSLTESERLMNIRDSHTLNMLFQTCKSLRWASLQLEIIWSNKAVHCIILMTIWSTIRSITGTSVRLTERSEERRVGKECRQGDTLVSLRHR